MEDESDELLALWQEFLAAQEIIDAAGHTDNHEDRARAMKRQSAAIGRARQILLPDPPTRATAEWIE